MCEATAPDSRIANHGVYNRSWQVNATIKAISKKALETENIPAEELCALIQVVLGGIMDYTSTSFHNLCVCFFTDC